MTMNTSSHSEAYAAAGVDITAGYQAVELMKAHIARTMTAGVASDIGGFGGLFELDTTGMERPVLVITDDETVAADEPGVRSLCLKKSVSESLISLVFACIMTYLSSVMPLRASDIYMHGHAGVYQEDGLPTVRGSKVDVVL